MEKSKADYFQLSEEKDKYKSELEMKKKKLDNQEKELKSIRAKYQEVKRKVCTYIHTYT